MSAVHAIDRSETVRRFRDGPRSEAQLIAAARAGERAAAETLVERSYELIFGALCRLCGDRDLASDLTQETYRRAWASLGTFRSDAAFSTWLYRIAYTTFLNHRRRPSLIQPLLDGEAEALADPQPRADRQAEQEESAGRLRRAVLGLPESLRLVVTAHFWGEAPIRDVAKLEGVTTVAIRKRLKKALSSLRERLEQGGLTS
jgi:RNA polymerase sigma-70 factor (ECF subfamily)